MLAMTTPRAWSGALIDEPWQPRFWGKIIPEPNTGCWLWDAGCDNDGYSRFWLNRKLRTGHQVMYELMIGTVPPGLQIDHLCRQRSCVNPAHLEAVTGRTNTLRGNAVSAINAAKTHCLRGHQFVGSNLRYTKHGHRECVSCRCEKDRRGSKSRWLRFKQRRAAAAEGRS